MRLFWDLKNRHGVTDQKRKLNNFLEKGDKKPTILKTVSKLADAVIDNITPNMILFDKNIKNVPYPGRRKFFKNGVLLLTWEQNFKRFTDSEIKKLLRSIFVQSLSWSLIENSQGDFQKSNIWTKIHRKWV